MTQILLTFYEPMNRVSPRALGLLIFSFCSNTQAREGRNALATVASRLLLRAAREASLASRAAAAAVLRWHPAQRVRPTPQPPPPARAQAP